MQHNGYHMWSRYWLPFLEHLSSHPVFSGVRVAWSFVFLVHPWLSFYTFYFGLLSFFDLRLLITNTPMVFPNVSWLVCPCDIVSMIYFSYCTSYLLSYRPILKKSKMVASMLLPLKCYGRHHGIKNYCRHICNGTREANSSSYYIKDICYVLLLFKAYYYRMHDKKLYDLI